jgi:hypothetical protein
MDRSFRDGMPWWAWLALVLARLAALLPILAAVLLAVWLSTGGARELPRVAARAVHAVQAWADSVARSAR